MKYHIWHDEQERWVEVIVPGDIDQPELLAKRAFMDRFGYWPLTIREGGQ